MQVASLESLKGKVIANMENGDEVNVPNRGLRLFPYRAILRGGKDEGAISHILNP